MVIGDWTQDSGDAIAALICIIATFKVEPDTFQFLWQTDQCFLLYLPSPAGPQHITPEGETSCWN